MKFKYDFANLESGRSTFSGSLHWCLLLLTFALCTHSGQGLAGIHTCKEPTGELIFQDRPCPENPQRSSEIKKTRYLPLGIHESWFAIPDQAADRAFCDSKGCECGDIVQRYAGSLERAVADSMYLDGAWHRYEESYNRWLDASGDATEISISQQQMMDASCHVMMAQELLRKHGEAIATSLKSAKRFAEERGFDVDAPCKEGIPDACLYLDRLNLYKRLIKDAKALKNPRGLE